MLSDRRLSAFEISFLEKDVERHRYVVLIGGYRTRVNVTGHRLSFAIRARRERRGLIEHIFVVLSAPASNMAEQTKVSYFVLLVRSVGLRSNDLKGNQGCRTARKDDEEESQEKKKPMSNRSRH